MSESEIKEIKNLGKKSFDEITECLAEHGFGKEYEIDPHTRVELINKLEALKAK